MWSRASLKSLGSCFSTGARNSSPSFSASFSWLMPFAFRAALIRVPASRLMFVLVFDLLDFEVEEDHLEAVKEKKSKILREFLVVL